MIHVKLAAINKPENAVELTLGRLGSLYVENESIDTSPEHTFLSSPDFVFNSKRI